MSTCSFFFFSTISFSLSLFVVDISFGERESNQGYFNLVFAFDNNTFFYLFKEKPRGEVNIIIIEFSEMCENTKAI